MTVTATVRNAVVDLACDRDQALPAGVPAPDLVLEIGSVTKVFTATLLALLTERGLVRLDTPVQSLLPDGVTQPVVGRPLTLLDLATHTAGLPRLPPGWLRRVGLRSTDPYAAFTEGDLWAAVASPRGRRAPGRVGYSNYGVGLLGTLLGRAAGTTWEDLLRREVLDPIGLRHTGTALPAELARRVATGHTRRGRPTAPWTFPVLAGAGALRSTATDLATFLRAQWELDEDTDLGRAVRATHQRRVGSRGLGGCLGWFTVPTGRPGSGSPDALWHNGGTGGFRSFVAVVPQRRVAVVALTNRARSVDRRGQDLLRAALAETDPPA